jgi:RNA polymerase sigma factor (sigma-70 family)
MGDPVAEAELHDFYTAFYRALALLSDRERIALRMRLEDELTFEQIGTMLGVSKMGAQKMVVRAEQKIRELLAQYRD